MAKRAVVGVDTRRRVHQTLKVSPAMAAGVTDCLWEISDIVQMLEDYESQIATEPSFDVEANKIGEGYFVRVTFPNGETESIYGFTAKADAIKWIRCEAVVWLWERRKSLVA
jgi:hypothetical protein